MNEEPTAIECTLDEFFRFMIPISRMLIECGCSSNRIESLAERLGASWNIQVEAMAIPTGVWISAKRGVEQKMDMVRVRDWSVDLDRLARLNSLVDSIERHDITIEEAEKIIHQEHQALPPYSALLTLLAGAGSSSVLMYFYGGSLREIGLAFPLGALMQLLQKYIFIGENRRYLGDFLSAVVAALYSVFIAKFFTEIEVPRLIISGIILLIPGLILTNAVHELAQKNLVSGAAKILEALMITGALGFGVFSVISLFG